MKLTPISPAYAPIGIWSYSVTGCTGATLTFFYRVPLDKNSLISSLNGIGAILWSGSTYEVGEHELTKDATNYNYFLVTYAISGNYYTEIVYKGVETKLTKGRVIQGNPTTLYIKPITINNNSFVLQVGGYGTASLEYATIEVIYIKSIRGLF